MSTLDDLLESHRGGCLNAEGDILSTMLPVIESMAASYCFNNSVDPDELVSDGMLGVLRAINKDNQGKSASFKTFASVCARNAMISCLRKKSSRIEGGVDFWDLIAEEDSNSGDAPATIEDLAEFSEVASIAAHAVKDLPEEQQQMILMITKGVLPDDIAEELSCTPDELKERLSRAVAFLAFELQMEAPEQAIKLARYCNTAGNPDKPLLRFMR